MKDKFAEKAYTLKVEKRLNEVFENLQWYLDDYDKYSIGEFKTLVDEPGYYYLTIEGIELEPLEKFDVKILMHQSESMAQIYCQIVEEIFYKANEDIGNPRFSFESFDFYKYDKIRKMEVEND